MDNFTHRSEEIVMNSDRVQLNVDGDEPELTYQLFSHHNIGPLLTSEIITIIHTIS